MGAGVLGGVLIREIGVRADAVDIILCGRRREKSSDKGERRNVRCAMIRDRNCLPGGIEESNSLKITDIEESVPN